MPIYEYQCTHCGEKTELLQKVTDPKPNACPHCERDTLQKIVSSTSFQLKGSGWYVTDFRDKNKPKPASETKPAAKTETSTTPSAEPAKSKDKTDKTD